MPGFGGTPPLDGSGGSGGALEISDGASTFAPSVNQTVNLENSLIWLQEEVPGDLGQRFIPAEFLELTKISLRDRASTNLVRNYNHRFQGHPESFKFNILHQEILGKLGQLYESFYSSWTSLEEQDYLYYPSFNEDPYYSEIALYNHCREQIRFKEWLLTRNSRYSKWFT